MHYLSLCKSMEFVMHMCEWAKDEPSSYFNCKKRFGKPDRELAGMGTVINLKYVC